MKPEDVAKIIINNIKVKFLNTKYVNENFELKLPYQFYEQPYIVGYISNFARWSYVLYAQLVLGKENTSKKEQLDFSAKVYKFLNLPISSLQTYLKLDNSKHFADNYFSNKNNRLWLLGYRHAKVSIFASYHFKSKNLSDEERELYEQAEKLSNTTPIPNKIPSSSLDSKFGSAILEVTIWKYLGELNIFKKEEDNFFLNLASILKKYSNVSVTFLNLNDKKLITSKIDKGFKDFENFSKNLNNKSLYQDKFVCSFFTLIEKTEEVELIKNYKNDLLLGFADFALDEWDNISLFYRGIAKHTLEKVTPKVSKTGRNFTSLFKEV